MAYPKPGELRHRCPQSRVARLRDALLAIDRPALPRRRGEAGIGGDRSAVVEVSGESFTPRTEANSGPMPWTSSNIGGGADTLACSALSSAGRPRSPPRPHCESLAQSDNRLARNSKTPDAWPAYSTLGG
jgi:hypothetical protein